MLTVASIIIGATVLTGAGKADEIRVLHTELLAIAKQNGIRGGAYAIIEDGKIIATRAFGYADAAESRPVTPETLFQAGSISKTVTSLVALSSVERGRIALDTKVSTLLPDAGIENRWRDDTPLHLVHLLEHTGGLPGSSYFETAQQGPNLSPSDFMARSRGRLTLRWPPGRYYSYANAGHTIAARMLEVASGRDFDTLAKDQVFAPLGMTTASFRTHGPDTAGRSDSFTADGSRAPKWPMAVRPSGALVASIADMARLALFLATEGSSVANAPVSVAGLRRMRQGEASLPARHGYRYSYGLGMFAFIAANRVFWGHWGKTEGFLATLGVLPDRRSGFVLLSNTSNRRGMTAMRERLGEFTGRDHAAPAALASAAASTRRNLTGLYVPFTHDMAIRRWLFAVLQAVVVNDGTDGLRLRSVLPFGGTSNLTPVSDRFYRSEGFPIATHLFLEKNGETVLFGDGQETYRQLRKAEALLFRAGLILAPTAIVLSILFAAVVAARRFFFGTQNNADTVFLCFAAAGAGLLVLLTLFAFFGVAGPLHDLIRLGEPSFQSLTLLALSIVWPGALLLGIALLVRRWRGMSFYRRSFGLMLAVIYLSIAGTLAWVDWLPLVTWRA